MSKSVSKTRFYIYAIALLPFILLLTTGLVMLYYHTGAPEESLFCGYDGHFWLLFHKIIAVITIPFILLHLFVKTDWVKNFFSLKVKGRFKAANIFLFIVFSLCLLTAFGSWLIFDDQVISGMLGGIHNKLGLLLILLFVIHIWNYRKLIISQFKKI
jgi:hypothetical protein